jgi:hypothetical protein
MTKIRIYATQIAYILNYTQKKNQTKKKRNTYIINTRFFIKMTQPKNINDYEFIRIQPSHRKGKKWDAVFKKLNSDRVIFIPFGAVGYLDFPLYYKYYKDNENLSKKEAYLKALKKRDNYLFRHKKENYDNFENWWRPSWWAANLLWSPEGIPDIKKQLKLLRKKYKF